MWRYRELLPPGDDRADRLARREDDAAAPLPAAGRRSLGCATCGSRTNRSLPTGSFKSRGLAMAITMARQFGIRRVAIPTAGNAGGAMAAYAARAGMEAFVFMPDDTPAINQYECRLAGAKTFLVNGLITDCGRIVREGKEPMGWFDISTLKEPYRIEGKKTMGLELAEQFDWTAARRDPLSHRRRHRADRHVEGVRRAGRTGLARRSTSARGWWPCSPTAAAPIVRAFERASGSPSRSPTPHTIASGIRVPAAVGDFMILDAVRESGGRPSPSTKARIREWMELGLAVRKGSRSAPKRRPASAPWRSWPPTAGSSPTRVVASSTPAPPRSTPPQWPPNCQGWTRTSRWTGRRLRRDGGSSQLSAASNQ